MPKKKAAPPTLHRSTIGQRTGIAHGLMAARAIERGQQMVPLDAIAINPENPREGRLEDLEGLTNSIREVGILQALLVCSRAAYLEGRPDAESALGEGEWVLLAGERRVIAAREAGIAEVPVVVRDDLAQPGRSHAVAAAENGLREALTPIQEARQYRHMLDANLSQRQVASAVGRSVGHINKRLRLLEVPVEVQDGLGTEFEIGAALLLANEVSSELRAEVATEALERRWPGEGGVSVQLIERAHTVVQRRHQNREEVDNAVAQRGAIEVEQIPSTQLIYHEEDLAAAQEAGTLVVSVHNPQHGGTVFYGDTRRQKEITPRDPEAERRAARKQLTAQVAGWLQDHLDDYRPKPRQNLTTQFARWIVGDLPADAGKQTWRLVRDLDIGPKYDANSYTGDERQNGKPYYDWKQNLSDADAVVVASLQPFIRDLLEARSDLEGAAGQRLRQHMGLATNSDDECFHGNTLAEGEGTK